MRLDQNMMKNMLNVMFVKINLMNLFLDLICNHKLCFNCSEKIINRYGDNKCPLCRINLYDTRSIISSYNNLSRYYLKIGIELTKKISILKQ